MDIVDDAADNEVRRSLGDFYPAIAEMLDAISSEKDPRKRKGIIRKIAEEFADGAGIQA